MTFRFLHTSDWHLGKAFGNLPADVAGLVREARLDAITALADVARHGSATHVMVAGDTFDSETPRDSDVRAALAALARHDDLSWHLLPGNHDPVRRGGVWEQVARLGGLPDHVTLHSVPEPAALSDDVYLLPAPLTSRAMGVDPSAVLDSLTTAPGVMRIGLAHGSVQTFNAEGTGTTVIAADRAARAGLDYLALGDWHGLKVLNPDQPRAAYSGTPEPDQFRENGAGQGLLVTVNGPRQMPRLEPRPTARFTWRRVEPRMASLADLEAAVAHVRAGSAPRRTLLRLKVSGHVPLRVAAEARALAAALEGEVLHVRASFDDLRTTPDDEDLQVLAGDAILHSAALELMGRLRTDQTAGFEAATADGSAVLDTVDPDGVMALASHGSEDKVAAARALQLLHGYAREAKTP